MFWIWSCGCIYQIDEKHYTVYALYWVDSIGRYIYNCDVVCRRCRWHQACCWMELSVCGGRRRRAARRLFQISTRNFSGCGRHGASRKLGTQFLEISATSPVNTRRLHTENLWCVPVFIYICVCCFGFVYIYEQVHLIAFSCFVLNYYITLWNRVSWYLTKGNDVKEDSWYKGEMN